MEKIQEMVLAAKKGDMDAFSWLYKEIYERNYYIVIKMIRHEQDAMDILQDTYVKVFQKLSSFNYSGSQSFASWTSKIASNTALDFLRKKKMVLFSELSTEEDIQELEFEDETVRNQPELALDQKETARIVHELMDCLSEEQRVCVILRYIRQMKISEIAIECNCSENTIKSRLNYARKHLLSKKESLEKKGINLYGIAPFALLDLLLEKDAQAFHAPQAVAEFPDGILEKAFGGLDAMSYHANDAKKVAVKEMKSAIGKWSVGKIAAVIMVTMALLGAGIYFLQKETPESRGVTTDVTASPDSRAELDSVQTVEPVPSAGKASRPEEDIYYEYINEKLVSEYGLAKLNQEGELTYYQGMDSPALDKRNHWLKPSGILSAYIEDLDKDGQKELFVLYWKKKKDKYFAHKLIGEVYGLDEENVICMDSVVISGLGYDWNEFYDIVGNFIVADMAGGKNKYLLFVQYDNKSFFADGHIRGMCSMEYKDGRLEKVQEVLQTSGGSDAFVYTGYSYKEGKCEEELLYDMYGDTGPVAAYDTVEEAFTKYFKREKLDVTEIVKCHESYINEIGWEAGFLDRFKNTKGATLICTLNGWMQHISGDGPESKAGYYLTGKDKTKLRKHIIKK